MKNTWRIEDSPVRRGILKNPSFTRGAKLLSVQVESLIPPCNMAIDSTISEARGTEKKIGWDTTCEARGIYGA